MTRGKTAKKSRKTNYVPHNHNSDDSNHCISDCLHCKTYMRDIEAELRIKLKEEIKAELIAEFQLVRKEALSNEPAEVSKSELRKTNSPSPSSFVSGDTNSRAKCLVDNQVQEQRTESSTRPTYKYTSSPKNTGLKKKLS